MNRLFPATPVFFPMSATAYIFRIPGLTPTGDAAP